MEKNGSILYFVCRIRNSTMAQIRQRVVWPHDSTARPICYVCLIRRHEALWNTYKHICIPFYVVRQCSIVVCVCKMVAFFLHCNKYTKPTIGAKPHADYVALNHSSAEKKCIFSFFFFVFIIITAYHRWAMHLKSIIRCWKRAIMHGETD